MRKALIVGIDYYANISGLKGCVNDAYAMKAVLERNADGTLNFPKPNVLLGTSPEQQVSRNALKDAVRELFEDDADIALFYFAGHGYIEDTGGYICASDCRSGDDGLALSEVMTFATGSDAKNKIIILDSCHSGVVADHPLGNKVAEISDGVTILTASTEKQYAMESAEGGSGVFTSLLVDALSGAAANLMGDITPGSAYAHIDQSLGPWAQRPVFKTNVKTFVSLCTTKPPIALDHLRAITTHFPTADHQIALDPSFEPERSGHEDPNVANPDPVNKATFKILQNYVKVNLARPVDAPHMWHAAMQSKACELTVLGQHYWKLVNEELI